MNKSKKHLLVLAVDPGGLLGRPGAQVLVLEPELDLVLGRLHGVAAVDDVAPHLQPNKG